VTENGFTYSSSGVSLAPFGNPGNDAEGVISLGGGVLKIVSATAGNFTFDDVDFAAINFGGNTGTQTLTVKGLLGGSVIGMDTYTLTNTNNTGPPYGNWTTEAASVLKGVTISELDIPLPAPGVYEAIDNVVLTSLTPTPAPEPSSIALLATGLLGLALMLYRHKAI
jgi:hypothetical protein